MYNSDTKKVAHQRTRAASDRFLGDTKSKLKTCLHQLIPSAQARRGRKPKNSASPLSASSPFTTSAPPTSINSIIPVIPNSSEAGGNSSGAELLVEVTKRMEIKTDALTEDHRTEMATLLERYRNASALANPNRAREHKTTTNKMAKVLHQYIYKDYVSMVLHSKTSSSQVLLSCKELLSTSSSMSSSAPSEPWVVMVVSAANLWELLFSKNRKQAQIWDLLSQLAENYPARYSKMKNNIISQTIPNQ